MDLQFGDMTAPPMRAKQEVKKMTNRTDEPLKIYCDDPMGKMENGRGKLLSMILKAC
jgi:hypothetical protein